MNEITLRYMQKLSKIIVNDRGNQNIVYTAANLPPYFTAAAAKLAGNRNGNTSVMSIAQNPNTTANQVIAAMRNHIVLQGRVRNMRYRHTITGNAAPAGTPLDTTALSMTNINGVLGAMGDISAPFGANSDISLDTFTDYYDKLYQRYLATYRGTPQLVQQTVCHGSCHNQCHYARGRR